MFLKSGVFHRDSDEETNRRYSLDKSPVSSENLPSETSARKGKQMREKKKEIVL